MEQKPKAVILDDDETSLVIFTKIFQRGGYEIVQAKSREEALSHCADSAVRLLISGVLLHTCSGIAVVTDMLHRRPDLKVILTSASPSEDWPDADRTAIRRLPRGCYVFLPKPGCVRQMLERADGLLNRPHTPVGPHSSGAGRNWLEN